MHKPGHWILSVGLVLTLMGWPCHAKTTLDRSAPSDATSVESVDAAYETGDTPQSDIYAPAQSRRKMGLWAGNPRKFFGGALVGFLGHEAGHLIANLSLGTTPYTKSINFGPIPFFTIEPGRHLTNREHYITASAGFNAQNIINEWALTTYPNLRTRDDPFLKGVVTFNFWLSIGYAATAFAGAGPEERDTKGMANALGWNERWVGVMMLAPTLLDHYRYYHPEAKWARNASRITKIFMLGFVPVYVSK